MDSSRPQVDIDSHVGTAASSHVDAAMPPSGVRPAEPAAESDMQQTHKRRMSETGATAHERSSHNTL